MITVNAMGDNCPIPVIKTKKAMDALTGPETIEVLVDNEIAVQNVTKMAKGAGGEVSSEKLGEASFKVTVKMQGAPKIDPRRIRPALRTQGATPSWWWLPTGWARATTSWARC